MVFHFDENHLTQVPQPTESARVEATPSSDGEVAAMVIENTELTALTPSPETSYDVLHTVSKENPVPSGFVVSGMAISVAKSIASAIGGAVLNYAGTKAINLIKKEVFGDDSGSMPDYYEKVFQRIHKDIKHLFDSDNIRKLAVKVGTVKDYLDQYELTEKKDYLSQASFEVLAALREAKSLGDTAIFQYSDSAGLYLMILQQQHLEETRPNVQEKIRVKIVEQAQEFSDELLKWRNKIISDRLDKISGFYVYWNALKIIDTFKNQYAGYYPRYGLQSGPPDSAPFQAIMKPGYIAFHDDTNGYTWYAYRFWGYKDETRQLHEDWQNSNRRHYTLGIKRSLQNSFERLIDESAIYSKIAFNYANGRFKTAEKKKETPLNYTQQLLIRGASRSPVSEDEAINGYHLGCNLDSSDPRELICDSSSKKMMSPNTPWWQIIPAHGKREFSPLRFGETVHIMLHGGSENFLHFNEKERRTRGYKTTINPKPRLEYGSPGRTGEFILVSPNEKANKEKKIITDRSQVYIRVNRDVYDTVNGEWIMHPWLYLEYYNGALIFSEEMDHNGSCYQLWCIYLPEEG